jgi:hypothetical protein
MTYQLIIIDHHGNRDFARNYAEAGQFMAEDDNHVIEMRRDDAGCMWLWRSTSGGGGNLSLSRTIFWSSLDDDGAAESAILRAYYCHCMARGEYDVIDIGDSVEWAGRGDDSGGCGLVLAINDDHVTLRTDGADVVTVATARINRADA